MKKIILLTTCILAVSTLLNAQLYTSDSSILHLNNGAVITANNIDVVVNANVTGNNNGKLLLKGNAVQTLAGNNSKIYGMEISNTTSINLLSNVEVDGSLLFTNGKFNINGNTFTLSGAVSGSSASNSFIGSNASKFIVTTGIGTAFFDQTTSADAATNNGTNALQNLVKSGSGTFTIGNKLNVFNQLASTNGTIDLGGNVVLRSTATNTAYLDKVEGIIIGQATVERYIHRQFRGWRALTAPITYNGIAQGYVSGNWQSDFGYASNYGTRITGPTSSIGMDDYTTGSSMQVYNSNTGSWRKVTNTHTETQSGNAESAANKGFYIFVRGDRTVLPNAATFVPTTLAAKGKLQTGTQVFNYSGAANKIWLLGNPYACPIDMSLVTFGNLKNSYVYVWDPTLTGYNTTTTGNYATFDRTSWASGPNSGGTTQYFQSGQAFFVYDTSASATVTFTESCKVSSSNNNVYLSRGTSEQTNIMNIKVYHIKPDGTSVETDGVRAKFGNGYSAEVDNNDAVKWITNGIENLSLMRNGKQLSIEARPVIVGSDTLFLNTAAMNVSNYQFQIMPYNFGANIKSCKLVDQFLNTETPININTATTIAFNITSTLGSNNSNRFYIVFNGKSNPCSNGVIAMDSIIGSNSICMGDSKTYTNNTVLPSGANGVWSSSNNKLTINSNGVVTANGVGVTAIKYEINNGACRGSITKAISVNALPAIPAISYAVGTINPQVGTTAGNFCTNKTFTVVGSPIGGIWTKTGVIEVNNNGNVNTGSNAGTATLTYTYTNISGCSNKRTIAGNVVSCAAKGNLGTDESIISDVIIYPNPARGNMVNLQIDKLVGGGNIMVTDLFGKQILNQVLSMGNNTIDISKLAKSTYFVSVVINGEKIVKKLVVE